MCRAGGLRMAMRMVVESKTGERSAVHSSLLAKKIKEGITLQ
jgi:hypothetical protein